MSDNDTSAVARSSVAAVFASIPGLRLFHLISRLIVEETDTPSTPAITRMVLPVLRIA